MVDTNELKDAAQVLSERFVAAKDLLMARRKQASEYLSTQITKVPVLEKTAEWAKGHKKLMIGGFVAHHAFEAGLAGYGWRRHRITKGFQRFDDERSGNLARGNIRHKAGSAAGYVDPKSAWLQPNATGYAVASPAQQNQLDMPNVDVSQLYVNANNPMATDYRLRDQRGPDRANVDQQMADMI